MHPPSIRHPMLEFAAQSRRLTVNNYPFRLYVRARWSDFQDGVLSRVATAHLFEDIRVHMMGQLLGERFGDPSWKAVARALSIEQLASARWDGQLLELAGGIAAIGRSSYRFALAAYQRDTCVALGEVVGVQVDAQGRPQAMDDAARLALERGLMDVAGGTA